MSYPEPKDPRTKKSPKHQASAKRNTISNAEIIPTDKNTAELKRILLKLSNQETDLETLKEESYVLYHVSSNSNLVKFEDLSQQKTEFRQKKNRYEELKNKSDNLFKEAQRTGDFSLWQDGMSQAEEDEMLKLTKELSFGEKPLETGVHGERGGSGIYLSSKPYMWASALSEQDVDLGDYVYEVLILNPKKREEYLQPAGSTWGELPETVINHNEGIIIGKEDETSNKKLIKILKSRLNIK